MAKSIMLYYSGTGRDPHGNPGPLYSYLVRAESCDSPPGSGVATIVTEADDVRIHKQHFVMSGGATQPSPAPRRTWTSSTLGSRRLAPGTKARLRCLAALLTGAERAFGSLGAARRSRPA